MNTTTTLPKSEVAEALAQAFVAADNDFYSGAKEVEATAVMTEVTRLAHRLGIVHEVERRIAGLLEAHGFVLENPDA